MLQNLFRTSTRERFVKASRTGRKNFLPLLFVVPIIVFFLITKVSEYDIWYHLAVGKEILRLGSFPDTDQLSLFNLGQPFQPRLWLFRTVTAAGYSFAGYLWLQALQILVWSTTFWAAYRSIRHWTNSAATWTLLLVTAIACSGRFTIRPEIISYLMIAVYYWRLQQGRHHSTAELTFFFILQEIWTCSHGLFSIGPFLVFSYFFVALTKGVRSNNYNEVRSLGVLLSIVIAGCLITPTGFDSIKYTWQLITTVAPEAVMAKYNMFELAPPLGATSRSFIEFWFFWTLMVSFLTSLLSVMVWHRKRLPLARTLIASVMLAVSMTGIRNMPIFAIVAAPLIAEYFSLIESIRFRRIIAAIIASIIILSTIIWSPKPALNYLTTWVPYRFGIGMSADYVPIGLPSFLNRIDFRGSVFNSQTLGGFYAYHGGPKRIPFYDFRLEDFNLNELKKVFDATYTAYAQPDAWHEMVRRYDFRGVLLENAARAESAGMLPLLSSEPFWRLVYLDYAASFWMRSDQPNLPSLINQNEVKRLIEGVQNTIQADNLDAFLERTNLFPELRLQLLEESVRRWGNITQLTNLGSLKMKSGMIEDAEELFKRVLKREPKSLTTLTTLAQIALLQGDKRSAETYLLKALIYYPSDTVLRENYNLVLKTR